MLRYEKNLKRASKQAKCVNTDLHYCHYGSAGSSKKKSQKEKDKSDSG